MIGAGLSAGTGPDPATMPHHEDVPPDHTFDELLRAAVDGASWGHRELWNRYAPAVAAYAGSQGCEDPEAVASDAFLAVFRLLPRFTGDEGGFRALLFTIARRRVLDDRRRRSRRVLQRPWTPEEDPRVSPSPEHEVLSSEGRVEAIRLLDTLPADQREVLMLRLFGELTVSQVAQAVGKSDGAVKALQRRGLERLRRARSSRAGNGSTLASRGGESP